MYIVKDKPLGICLALGCGARAQGNSAITDLCQQHQETLDACARLGYNMLLLYDRMALADFQRLDWERATDEQKYTARICALAVLDGASAEGVHNVWLSHRSGEGWRLGPKKNPDQKEHPALRPWQSLPDFLRAKAEIFRAAVQGFQQLC